MERNNKNSNIVDIKDSFTTESTYLTFEYGNNNYKKISAASQLNNSVFIYTYEEEDLEFVNGTGKCTLPVCYYKQQSPDFTWIYELKDNLIFGLDAGKEIYFVGFINNFSISVGLLTKSSNLKSALSYNYQISTNLSLDFFLGLSTEDEDENDDKIMIDASYKVSDNFILNVNISYEDFLKFGIAGSYNITNDLSFENIRLSYGNDDLDVELRLKYKDFRFVFDRQTDDNKYFISFNI